MSQLLEYRMYEDEYPSEGDLVVVQVKSLARHGVYCSLLEYNGLEGLIMLSELSRRRTMAAKAHPIQVGKIEVCQVLTVDRRRGYIDLSKKRVDKGDVQRSERLWNDSKAVHSMLRHVARSYNACLRSVRSSSSGSSIASQSHYIHRSIAADHGHPPQSPPQSDHYSSSSIHSATPPRRSTVSAPSVLRSSMMIVRNGVADSDQAVMRADRAGGSPPPPPLSVRSMPSLLDGRGIPGSTSPYSLCSVPLSMEVLYKKLIWPMVRLERTNLFKMTHGVISRGGSTSVMDGSDSDEGEPPPPPLLEGMIEEEESTKSVSMSTQLLKHPSMHAFHLLKKAELEGGWDELIRLYPNVLQLSVPFGGSSSELQSRIGTRLSSSSASSASSSGSTGGRSAESAILNDEKTGALMSFSNGRSNVIMVWQLLRKEVAKRLQTRIRRYCSIIEVSCFTKKGIISIKECFVSVLSEHNALSDDFVANIKSMKAPRYIIEINGSSRLLTPARGYHLIMAMVKDIRERMENEGGKCVMKKEPFFKDANEFVFCSDRMSVTELSTDQRATTTMVEDEHESGHGGDSPDDGRSILPELTGASDSSSSPIEDPK